MAKLRVAVITDIHCHSLPVLSTKATSWVSSQITNSSEEPFDLLISKLQGNVTADILVCGGDMADKADPAGHSYVWPKLMALKSALKASHLIATIGNHDIDSRLQKSSFDPKDSIQSLTPPLPLETRQAALEYWTENFAVLEEDDYRFVVVNTCAFHGYKKGAEAEFLHGRISARTLHLIEEYLNRSAAKKLNVLVCHHHPIKFDDIDIDDYSHMIGGDQLIQLLSRPKFGSWMIIHGHKHQSRLIFAPGTNDSPLVFAAGSFGAKLHSQMARIQANQFYILEFDLDAASSIGAGVFGQLEAWSLTPTKSWSESRDAEGLLPGSGFGCRARAADLAQKIATWFQSTGQPYSTWDEAKVAVPELRHCTNDNLDLMQEALETNHRIEISSSSGRRNIISSIDRRV